MWKSQITVAYGPWQGPGFVHPTIMKTEKRKTITIKTAEYNRLHAADELLTQIFNEHGWLGYNETEPDLVKEAGYNLKTDW
jgi:hypothetical protein